MSKVKCNNVIVFVFFYSGNLGRIDNDVATLSGSYSVYVDITRRMQFVEETLSTGTTTTTTIRLSSASDNTTYLSVNGVCSEMAFEPDNIFPLNTSIWDSYASGTEHPTGTYTFAQDGIIHQIMLVDGIPALIGTRSGATVIVIFVSKFDNMTPASSTFTLPSECSQFTCSECFISQVSLLSNLSPRYSLQGALTRTEDGTLTTTADYSVVVNIDLRLQYVQEIATTSGVVSNNLRLSSETDSATYLSVNGMCTETAFSPDDIFPIDSNVWDLYATGTEDPAGTFTFTQYGITYQLTTDNGNPTSFTSSFNTTVIVITVINFDNVTPGYSTFTLPSECSQFTCTSCYSSAVSVSISIVLLLTTSLMYLFTTL